MLSGAGRPDAYVEVKSVTLSRTPGLAEFPDSVTTRGAKHLRELAGMAAQGHRSVMLYLVQRTDSTSVTLAEDLDPEYAAAFDAADDVEVMALTCAISPEGIEVGHAIPFNRHPR